MQIVGPRFQTQANNARSHRPARNQNDFATAGYQTAQLTNKVFNYSAVNMAAAIRQERATDLNNPAFG